MKPGGPLKRTQGLKRTTRIKPVSDRRAAERPERDAIREAVFTRDGGQCRLGSLRTAATCSGGLSVHHLRKAAQGGSYDLATLLTLCLGHNSWVEDEPKLAHSLGLVCRAGETLRECWLRMAAAGLVDYGPSGAKTQGGLR